MVHFVLALKQSRHVLGGTMTQSSSELTINRDGATPLSPLAEVKSEGEKEPPPPAAAAAIANSSGPFCFGYDRLGAHAAKGLS
jgi:hypothetical protein